MAELRNFGAVFTFAIDMESRIADYYRGLGNEEAAKTAEKNSEKLERARREYVTEITLEPIDDLDEDNYGLNVEDTSASGQSAVNMVAKRFYTDAAPKINVRQAQRVLERCGNQYS